MGSGIRFQGGLKVMEVLLSVEGRSGGFISWYSTAMEQVRSNLLLVKKMEGVLEESVP